MLNRAHTRPKWSRVPWISQNTKWPAFSEIYRPVYTDRGHWYYRIKSTLFITHMHEGLWEDHQRIILEWNRSIQKLMPLDTQQVHTLRSLQFWGPQTSSLSLIASLSSYSFSQWEPSPQLLALSTPAPSSLRPRPHALMLRVSDYLLISWSQPRWVGWLKGQNSLKERSESKSLTGKGEKECSQWQGERVSAGRKIESVASQLFYHHLFPL